MTPGGATKATYFECADTGHIQYTCKISLRCRVHFFELRQNLTTKPELETDHLYH